MIHLVGESVLGSFCEGEVLRLPDAKLCAVGSFWPSEVDDISFGFHCGLHSDLYSVRETLNLHGR